MQNKMPVHLADFRELQLRAGRNQFQNLILYFMLPETGIQSKQRLLANGPRHGSSKIRKEFPVDAVFLFL